VINCGGVGPILFQLPPNFRRYSFEFRDPSWYAARILKMPAERNISLCLWDHHDAPPL
jgi:uncharacterized protein YecE (DUF72 family)